MNAWMDGLVDEILGGKQKYFTFMFYHEVIKCRYLAPEASDKSLEL